MPEERRRYSRRASDKLLLERVHSLEQQVDRRSAVESKEQKRSRRRAIRHNCTITLRYVPETSEGAVAPGGGEHAGHKDRVLDLSAEGASVLAKESVEIGRRMDMTLTLRDGTKISTLGEVKWVKAVPEKRAHALGIYFVDVPEAGRTQIQRFLDELDANAGL